MSSHKLCCELSSVSHCTKTQAVYFGREIARAGAGDIRPGMSIGAQILESSRNLDEEHGLIWRAWHGRCGPKNLPRLIKAFVRFVAREDAKAEQNLAGLHRRLDSLERHRGLAPQDMGSEPPARLRARQRR